MAEFCVTRYLMTLIC